MKWYVATISAYVIVDAPNESAARAAGEEELRQMLGRVPNISVVRKATQQEIEDQDWHNSQFSDSPSVVESLRSRHPKAFESGPSKTAVNATQLSDAPVQLADAEFEFQSNYSADQFLQRIRAGRPNVSVKKNGHYVECSFSDKDAEFVFEQAKKLGADF